MEFGAIFPDDPTQPDAGNRKRLLAAKALYEEARQIFAAHREDGKAEARRAAREEAEADETDDNGGDDGQKDGGDGGDDEGAGELGPIDEGEGRGDGGEDKASWEYEEVDLDAWSPFPEVWNTRLSRDIVHAQELHGMGVNDRSAAYDFDALAERLAKLQLVFRPRTPPVATVRRRRRAGRTASRR